MADQEKYSINPSQNSEEILTHSNSDAKEMRAKAATTRIQAQQQAAQIKIEASQYAELDAQLRAEIEKIPPELRYVPDQAS